MFDLTERLWELPTHVPFAAQGKWPAVAAPTPASYDLDMLRLGGERSGILFVWQHAFAEQAVAGQVCMQTSRRRGLCCHTTSSQLAGWVRMLGPLAVWSCLTSAVPWLGSGAPAMSNRDSAAGGAALIPVNAAPAAFGPVHSTGQPYEFCQGAGALQICNSRLRLQPDERASSTCSTACRGAPSAHGWSAAQPQSQALCGHAARERQAWQRQPLHRAARPERLHGEWHGAVLVALYTALAGAQSLLGMTAGAVAVAGTERARAVWQPPVRWPRQGWERWHQPGRRRPWQSGGWRAQHAAKPQQSPEPQDRQPEADGGERAPHHVHLRHRPAGACRCAYASAG